VGRLHLGSILGTTITVDFTFLILIGFFVLSYLDRWGGPQALLWRRCSSWAS